MEPVDARPVSAPGHPARGETTTSGAPVTIAPTLVRVSVLGGNTQLDVALPAAIPIAALIGDLVAQIESRNPIRADADESDPDGGPPRLPARPEQWTLARVGQEPYAPNRSLAESGVRHGDLLMLTSSRTDESPALFDDVVDAVARLSETRFANWSPDSARHLGHLLALLAAVAGAVTLGAIRATDDAIWPAGPSGLVTLALIVAAMMANRHRHDPATTAVLAMAAMPMAFVTGMMLTPGQHGAAHLTLGSAFVLTAAAISYRLTGAGPAAHSAVSSAALLTAAACGVRLVAEVPVAHLAAVTAAVGFLVITWAPRVTIVLAKLPLPPVPTAGAPLDIDDIEPRPAIEGIGAIGAMALPKADALERRSYVANAYLTGIVGGVTAVTAVSAVLAAAPLAGFAPRSAAFAAIIGIVLCLRGRSHSDLVQAATLIIGGSLTLLALTVGLAFGDGDWPVISFLLATTFVVGAFVFGVITPNTEFSPVMRRTAEIFEYLLIAIIVPLLLWILDLYRIVREI